MFLCGNFCNSGVDEPQIIFQNQQDWRQYQKQNSELKQTQLKGAGGAFAMIRRSDYKRLREDCLKNNSKFEDKDFPANQKSLNFSIANRQITWRRISDIMPNCVMQQNGICPADIQQGNIGDCYFLASISALAENPDRVRNIFKDNFEVSGNCIYKVIACVEGAMTEVVIDDYVPVYASTNRPVFCKANGREIWVMLLEKAWAKIKGSYGSISAGTPHEVLNTFSIAPCFNFPIHSSQSEEYKDTVWNELLEASVLDLPTCAGSREEVNLAGLKPLHTYTVLSCANVAVSGINYRIMRLRNPWGQTEYTGFASENDTKFWSQVPKEIKALILPAQASDDGDFTIPFTQFIKNFEVVDICHSRNGFSYQFQTLHLAKSVPTFVRLEVKENHETYITVEKVCSQEAREDVKDVDSHGYFRMIIAKQTGSKGYQYFTSKLETNYADLSLRCSLTAGQYLIMVEGDYLPGYQKFDAIFSYYYQSLQDKGNKIISVQNYDQLSFLREVFMNHAYRMSADMTKLSSRPEDWIKTTLLYEQGGYGYVACSLQKQTNFKLHIAINQATIQQNGFRLLGRGGGELDIEAGCVEIFVFEMDLKAKSAEQLTFPPEGFRISKVV